MPSSCAVSVVIPTYRRCASLRRALEALSTQTFPSREHEVVVAIDGSDDGTREMVASFRAPYEVRAIWQPNRGRAAACNAGVQAARGELVVFLDDDMEPTPELLSAHCLAHPFGSRLGILGAAPVEFDATSPSVVAYVGAKFNRHLTVLAQPGYQLKLRDFYSGNFSIPRSILLEVGGFDEDFTIYGNEDLELSVRLLRAGVSFAYSAEARATQHYTKSFASLTEDTMAKGRTAILLARKHPRTFDDLKLSQYGDASRAWRVVREALLRAHLRWPCIARIVVWAAEWLGRWRPGWVGTAYSLALDYFYWLGARSADESQEVRLAQAAISFGRDP